jgi:hypothetical protein
MHCNIYRLIIFATVDVALEEINIKTNNKLNSSKGAGIQIKLNFLPLQPATPNVGSETRPTFQKL